MVNSTLKLRQGVNVLLNRGNKTTPDYTIPDQFKVSINTPDVTWTDTTLTTAVPISGTESVDDCSVTTGWTASGTNSVSANATTFKPDSGTDGALNIIKSDTSSATITVSKTVTSRDATSKDLSVWLYIIDATALAKFVSVGDALAIRYGSDSSNYYEKVYAASSLATGWNWFTLAVGGDFDTTTGTPSLSAMDYFYIELVTNNTSDTFSSGDIIMDSIRLASSDDYIKNCESSPTFDETEGSVAIISKLTVTEANGFLLNGHALFNQDGTAKMTDKAKTSDNSKGTTDLFKYTTKVKIRNINQL